MNNVTRLSTENRSDVEAGKWIARIDRDLSSVEKEELASWLSESTENYQAFLETAKLWDEMDALALLSEVCPKTVRRKTSSLQYTLPIAATVLLTVAAAFWYANSSQVTDVSLSSVATIALSTDVGEQARHELADGSSLVLNTNSSVLVKFTDVNRVLVLERGEIHLVVAHDPARPLSVLVGSKVVRAIGTEFNIEITSDQSIELVVTEGLVVVGVLNVPSDELALNEPFELNQSATLVAGGQEAIIKHVEETIQQIEAEEIETEEIAVKLSWRTGNLVFRGETLEEAVQEVGRYTAVEFVFLDEEAKQERVAGLFKAGDVDGLLAILRENFNISYQWVGDEKVILAAGKSDE
jgi:transmembrane sensor